MRYVSTFVLTATLAVSGSRAADADFVKLSTGETVTCTVVSVDRNFVRVSEQSGNQRAFVRAGVKVIMFGDAADSPESTVENALNSVEDQFPRNKPITPEDFRQKMPADPDGEIYRMERQYGVGPTDRQQTPADVVRKLQYDGHVPQEILDDIFETFPLLRNPSSKAYFESTLNTLITGEKSLAELREEAIAARARLELVRKALGPDGDVLVQNYVDVLDRFIEQTEPE